MTARAAPPAASPGSRPSRRPYLYARPVGPTFRSDARVCERADTPTTFPRPSVHHRTHDEDVEGLVQREKVRPKPGQDHVLLDAEPPDLTLERLAQLSFASDHEAVIRLLLDDQRCRPYEVTLSLVRHQRSNVADD